MEVFHHMKLLRPLALLVFLLPAADALAAPPAAVLRAAIQPPAGQLTTEELRQPKSVAIHCLAAILHERLIPQAGVALVDPQRFAAIRDELTTPALVKPGRLTLAAFSARLPVDLLVQMEPADDGIAIEAAATGDAAPERVVVPYANARDFKKLLAATAPIVARRLGLEPDEAARLAWLDTFAESTVTGEAIVAALLSRSMRVEWGDAGLAKIDALAPHLDAARTSPTVARALLEAGLDLGRGNQKQSVDPAVRRLKLVVPFAIGTAAEPAAIAFLRATKYDRGGYEKDLVALLREFKKANEDSLDDAIEDALEEGPDAGEPGLIRDTSMAAGAVDGSSGVRQCGGLRALAAIQSKQAPALLAIAAKAADPRLRRAAAEGFGEFAAPEGDAALAALAADKDAAVAVAAMNALAARGRPPQGLIERVRKYLRDEPDDRAALELLCRQGTADDLPAIHAALRSADPQLRIAGWRGLLRLDAIKDGGAAWLADPDRLVAAAAFETLPRIDEKLLAALANDADWTLAEAARLRLGPLLPADPRQRRQRQLAFEHPYVRGRIVAALAAERSADAIADLATACGNADHIVRADAIAALARVAPAQARGHLAAALADPYRIVRLHAAAAAADCAESADATMLEKALRDETDEATRLHLATALARATGKPAPTPPAAAHVLGRDRNEVFLCGHGPGAASSPFRGYYDLAVMEDDAIRKAHADGKVVLSRVRTAPNPVQVALSRAWRDGYWLPFDAELLPALDFVDGVVIGEETMYFAPFQAWNDGWRLFCLEAGIDPATVAGNRDNLTERQRQAWWSWEQRVAIEGFNRIHDFVKLRYGRLRPGFQTATFMPDQNGPCLYDRDWKFDIAAAYYYDADNRERYARIRRLKTVWPDRPTLWLSYGIVNAESTSGGVKHDYRLPMRPQHALSSRAYADSVAAWLAGGHTGFYQIMLFMDPTMKPGPMAAGTWITIEDLFNGSKSLDKGLDTVFRGLAETYRLRSSAAGAKPKLDLDDEADLDGFSLEEKPAEDAATVRVKAERESLRRSFVLERRLIDDVARLLSGMPFPQNEKPALLVGDIAATRGVFRLPAEFDALDSIEKLAAQPLDGYRFIAVAASDKSAYRDAAIDAVVQWLSTQPGVLCVQGWLSTAGAMPLAMPEAIDAGFKSRWPWQDDITRSADGKIAVATSPRARIIAGTAESPEAVVWRGDGMRGAVVFQFDGKDVGGKTTAAIGKELARLATAEKPADRIGLAFTEPAGLVMGKAAGLTAFAAGRHVAGERNVRGMDLLTGRIDPALGAARAAAIVGESYRGEFVAAEAGVCVLGDAPLEAVEKIQGGLAVTCSGLVRAVAPGGVKVEWTGSAPPEVSTADGDESKFLAWLLESTAPGVATLPQKDGPPVTFIRTPAAIKLRPR
jgi:hypothetical protein